MPPDPEAERRWIRALADAADHELPGVAGAYWDWLEENGTPDVAKTIRGPSNADLRALRWAAQIALAMDRWAYPTRPDDNL